MSSKTDLIVQLTAGALNGLLAGKYVIPSDSGSDLSPTDRIVNYAVDIAYSAYNEIQKREYPKPFKGEQRYIHEQE